MGGNMSNPPITASNLRNRRMASFMALRQANNISMSTRPILPSKIDRSRTKQDNELGKMREDRGGINYTVGEIEGRCFIRLIWFN